MTMNTPELSRTPSDVLADFTEKREVLKARIPELQAHSAALQAHNTSDTARAMRRIVDEELSQTRSAIKRFDNYIISLQLMCELPAQLRTH